MKIVANEGLIIRNRKIGQVTTIASLVVLSAGLVLSFIQSDSRLVSLSFLALLVGFILSQVGIYFGNRYGRRPRPDESLDTGLKGLEDKYRLYHYVTPVSHLLLGPAGIWILLPYPQSGKIVYEKKRWKQKGGNWYLKIFAQDGLARPDLDVATAMDNLDSFFKKQLPDAVLPPVQALLLFTNDNAIVEADDAPYPTLHIKKVKEFLRKKAKESPTPPEKIKIISDILPQID
jgi:hypothetical protein